MIKHLPPRILTEKELVEYKKSQEFYFPIFQQVAARTMGMDLVSVQPMKAPTGILNYLDYVYNNNLE